MGELGRQLLASGKDRARVAALGARWRRREALCQLTWSTSLPSRALSWPSVSLGSTCRNTVSFWRLTRTYNAWGCGEGEEEGGGGCACGASR